MNYEEIQVECYSGHKANERPTAFTCRGNRHEIEEIIDRWYEAGIDPARPEISYFKIKTISGSVFILRYLSLFDSWSIKPL
ncbi:MAG: cytoplasmic protein [Deltaproteobacteria bacterium]|nr:cytoplasmic protein [Deltaproteobacteria bacterium]